MPQTFDPAEVWSVNTGKKEYKIMGNQAQVIKTASLSGQRGLIFFDGFAISIAHIVSMERIASAADVKSKSNTYRRYQEMKKIIETDSI